MRAKHLLLSFGLVLLAGTASAGDDPTVRGQLREEIQTAMREFIADNTVDGVYRHYDPVGGQLLQLALEELHAGIVRKGDFYVSCADFVDARGGVVDLDFLVIENGDEVRVSQAIVHKADGVKRPYHLESE
jgi:hypothetical protein